MGPASDHDPSTATPYNLLQVQRRLQPGEQFDDLLRRPGVRVERIVSRGHVTPADAPYQQDWDEWVLILRGAAELSLEGKGEYRLDVGDSLLVPAGVRHLVTYTADPTIWLAIHIEPDGST